MSFQAEWPKDSTDRVNAAIKELVDSTVEGSIKAEQDLAKSHGRDFDARNVVLTVLMQTLAVTEHISKHTKEKVEHILEEMAKGPGVEGRIAG